MGKDLVEVLWVIARAKSPSCCLASEESCCLGILVVELGCKDLAHSDKITSASAIMRVGSIGLPDDLIGLFIEFCNEIGGISDRGIGRGT
jgi:hypothetical protein